MTVLSRRRCQHCHLVSATVVLKVRLVLHTLVVSVLHLLVTSNVFMPMSRGICCCCMVDSWHVLYCNLLKYCIAGGMIVE